MRFKISIKTPKGQAAATQAKLKNLVLGRKVTPIESWVNEEDNTFYWDLETDVKNYVRIRYNVNKFDSTMRKVVDSKPLKKLLKKELSEADYTELGEMLINQTEIEIIGQATAEELVEANKTWWTKIKEKLKKHNPSKMGE